MNSYILALIGVISLCMFFSMPEFQVQSANAQNIDHSTGILSILSNLTSEQEQQIAANGTSFDGFIKHRQA